MTAAECDLIDKRLLEGATIPTVAAEVGRSWSAVHRRLQALVAAGRTPARRMGPPPKYPPPPTDLTCQHCSRPIVFGSPSDAWGNERKKGVYCSRECFLAEVKRGVVNTCPVCGKERYRPASHAHKKCCSYECSNRYRWQVSRKGIENLVRKCYGRLARQRWLGRLGGAAGAVHGIAGATRGREGGAPRVATEEQEHKVWNLWGDGESYRAIAEQVFGDPRLKDRVQRILRADD